MVKSAIGLALAAFALASPAEASWRCPSMYGAYYPAVSRCLDWQWDQYGPAEQAAAAEAQQAASQRAEAQRAAAEVQRATEQARLEVQREAEKARTIAAARTVAENSSDNICRNPKIAGILMEVFNNFDWSPDVRKVVDIEHLVTLADRDGYKSCHGVWMLADGRKIEGTVTLKTNVAGDPISHWQQETWQPAISVTAKPDAPVIVPIPVIAPAINASASSAFRDGWPIA
jgi:hypothetical protein